MNLIPKHINIKRLLVMPAAGYPLNELMNTNDTYLFLHSVTRRASSHNDKLQIICISFCQSPARPSYFHTHRPGKHRCCGESRGSLTASIQQAVTADTTRKAEPRDEPAGCDLITPMSSVCLPCVFGPSNQLTSKGLRSTAAAALCQCCLQGLVEAEGWQAERPRTTVILRAHACSCCFNSEVCSWKALIFSNKQSLENISPKYQYPQVFLFPS